MERVRVSHRCEVTKDEVAEFIVKGGKTLNGKFVYKLEDAQVRIFL